MIDSFLACSWSARRGLAHFCWGSPKEDRVVVRTHGRCIPKPSERIGTSSWSYREERKGEGGNLTVSVKGILRLPRCAIYYLPSGQSTAKQRGSANQRINESNPWLLFLSRLLSWAGASEIEIGDGFVVRGTFGLAALLVCASNVKGG